MPVPVPRVVHSTAHPVIKRTRGIPPLAKSQSWRAAKPRRIWEDDAALSEQCADQDFYQGLAVAGNAMAIKGLRAHACLPPLATNPPAAYPPARDDSTHEYYKEVAWKKDYAVPGEHGDGMDFDDELDIEDTSPDMVFTDLASYESQTYPRQSFKPAYHDQSPGTDSGPDSASSPLEPVTPFTDFIDRAVAAEQPSAHDEECIAIQPNIVDYAPQKQDAAQVETRVPPVFPTLAETVKEPTPAAPDVIIPSPTSNYRQLAQPLSEWLANYVWKVCTTGLSLSPVFTYPSSRAVHYQPIPPSHLAPSIHSLLLSTLLQPSAIFLGLWYIIRLPGYFNAAELGPEYPKEARFRHALLGDAYSYEREGLELGAPFRLVVLGCMLANKWLDDHTFSNKTWHTISSIPIQELNRLEAMALDVFTYDLSISNKEWAHWMSHLKSYHMSLAPSHLQPIGRPSSNPHSIIRRAIDEIVQAPSPDTFSPLPQPVFLGIEERKREQDKQNSSSLDILEINLDEDGPLKEEYMPKRRTNGVPIGHSNVAPATMDHENSQPTTAASAKPLPPPAKWSPAGDEPILRDRNRASGHYVAVQPSQPSAYSMAYRPHDVAYNPPWDTSFGLAFKAYPTYGYGHAAAAVPINPTSYNLYPQHTTNAMTHSRSQSLFFDSDSLSSRQHLRSYSQSGFDYKCSDVRMISQEHLATTFESEPRWIDTNQYLYPAAGYGAAVVPNSTWLRA